MLKPAPHGSPRRLAALVGASALVLLVACQGVTSDAAGRMAFGLREGAHRLGPPLEAHDSIVVRIPARTWPKGCPGPYRVELLADTAKVSGIRVSCLPKGRQYTSGSAKGSVRTPMTLELERGPGQPVNVTLKPVGTDIVVSALE